MNPERHAIAQGPSSNRHHHCCKYHSSKPAPAGEGLLAKAKWGWQWFWHLVFRNRVAIFIASLFWLLYRSGAQPRRLSYPCQQVAAVNVGAFIAALIPVSLFLRRNKGGVALPKAVVVRRQLIAAGIMCLVGVIGIETYQYADDLLQTAATLPDIPSPPAEPPEATVGIVHQPRAGAQYTLTEIDSMVERAIQRAGGLDQIMADKDQNNEILVALKPNLVNDISITAHPENGVVTDPRVMKTVVRMVKEAGVRAGIPTRVVIVEGTAGPEDWFNGYMGPDITKHAFIATGYTTDPVTGQQLFIYDSSVELIDLNDSGGLLEPYDPNSPLIDPNKVTLKHLDYGVIRSNYWVPNILLDCDVLISVPTLKNHGNADITAAMKNRIGCAPSDIYHARSNYDAGHTSQMKYALHFVDIPGLNAWDPGSGGGFYYPPQPPYIAPPDKTYENTYVNYSIVDMNMLRPQDFAVVDGLVGITDGPTGTTKPPTDMQMILAGTDSVAIDTISTLMMGYDPQYVRYLRLAYNRQLGTMNRGTIGIIGDRPAMWRQYFGPKSDTNRSPCETIPPTVAGISTPEGASLTNGDTITVTDFADTSPPPGQTGVARVEAAVTILGATNLVTNGDFENGSEGWTTWRATSWGTNEVWDFENPNVSPMGGQKCLRLGGPYTQSSFGVYQQIAVTPGKTYRVDCQWKGTRNVDYTPTPGDPANWWEVILIDGPYDYNAADQDPGVRDNYMFAYDDNTYGLMGPAGTSFGWIWTHEQYAPPKDQVDWKNRLGRRKATGSTMTVVLKAGSNASGGVEEYFDNVTLREVQSDDYIVASVGMPNATDPPNVVSPATLVADLTALPPGQYPGELRVTVYDAALNEASIYRNVLLSPVPEHPWVCANKDELLHEVFVADPIPGDTVEVWNCGSAGGDLTYSIEVSPEASWIHVDPDGGVSGQTTPPTINLHAVSYDPLPPGVHTGTITITGTHNVKTIEVTVTVTTVAPDFDLDGDVDQADFGKLQACYAGTTQVLTGPCVFMDLNADSYVTTADLPYFTNCVAGSKVYPDRDCY